MPEDYVYDRIDRNHKFAVLPKILTVCEIVKSGYTDEVERLRAENPTGWLWYYGQRVNNTKTSVLRLKYASHYLRFEKRVPEVYRQAYKIPLYMRILGLPGAAALAIKGKL